MSAHGFMEDDEVENTIELGGGVKKVKRGTVLSVGARGVQVQFPPPLGVTWMRASQVKLVKRARPDAPARVEQRPVPVPPPPPVERRPEPVSVAQDDPEITAWLEMGRGLLSRAEERVAYAREAVSSAEEAEQLAIAHVAEAKLALRRAEQDLSEVRRRTGEQRR